ncbi:LacI family DNA-binding transcriptional regulator [Salipaludibacillus agaradhaerens]|uniref:LacI family DNA-binding transcriptional regulator n=1 Tax=Salipaludibacillus agaradhaerens TaxID=76935 RepID=UPI002151D601|nr:LacI family DNA-binding transcriptional regulator [Salipaludibacillus agaradhaerens]MCR6107742.1 LacI family DNA-binding transcriptional regulator [Salipaludibacillus agaradhaerens]MCR6119771.1 LacI family DNA-binding transcriptional regulator [Salipaludibacillus agaradhaerens]UJW58829.1 LacI family DNA-binding transcriptional regulator [Bacillus sp. A116_S68]
MSVTIKDIAKVAGVSYSTVSKALRNSPLVKAPTKKRIMAIADNLGYHPNVAARSLVSKRSNTVGIIWPTVERAAHAALMTQINEHLEEKGYKSLISINNMSDAITTFQSIQVDAILIFYDQMTDQVPSIPDVPVLVYGTSHNSPFPVIDVNRKGALYLAVSHLIKAGHSHIAFIGDLSGRDPLQEEKVLGFKEGMLDGAGHIPSNLLINSNGMTYYDGYKAAEELLADFPSTITAIISGSFDLTKGIIRAVQEANLLIPENVTILSYDNIPQTTTFESPVSVIGVPLEKITGAIVNRLINMMEHKNIPPSTILSPELIEVKAEMPS